MVHEESQYSPCGGAAAHHAGRLRRQGGGRGIGPVRLHDLRYGLCGAGGAVCRPGQRTQRDGNQERRKQGHRRDPGRGGPGRHGWSGPVYLRLRGGGAGPRKGPAGAGAAQEHCQLQGEREGAARNRQGQGPGLGAALLQSGDSGGRHGHPRGQLQHRPEGEGNPEARRGDEQPGGHLSGRRPHPDPEPRRRL